MKYKSWKCNFLFYLSRIAWGREFKLFCEEFLKKYDAAPELASETWNMLYGNYKFRKKYKDKYKIISLGWDCMPRTLLTKGLLKPSKKMGEKSMPFDLIPSPARVIAHFLENDFSDYFDGQWTFEEESQSWHNGTLPEVFYFHDRDCTSDAAGLEKLQKRLALRIANFREAVALPCPVLFVLHKSTLDHIFRPTVQEVKDVERVCELIKELRGEKPFRIIVMSCNQDDDTTDVKGATFVRHLYPRPDYVWHYPERFTPEGVAFENTFLKICRNELIDLMRSTGVYKGTEPFKKN